MQDELKYFFENGISEMSTAFFCPASIANFGPCYDIVGYSVENLGDIILGRINKENNNVRITNIFGPYAKQLISSPHYKYEENCSLLAAEKIRKLLNINLGIDLVLFKNMPVSSGLGSSAVDAILGSACAMMLLKGKIDFSKIIDASLYAEEIVAGFPHPDNIIPSLKGGVYMMRKNDKFLKSVKIELGKNFYTIVVKPENIMANTKLMREILPDTLELQSAVDFAWKTASIIHSLQNGDIEELKWLIGQNDFLESNRGPKLKFFFRIQKLWIKNHAPFATIAGSGPSVFSIFNNKSAAKESLKFLKEALEKDKIKFNWLISKVSSKGLIEFPPKEISKIIKIKSKDHNFFKSYYKKYI